MPIELWPETRYQGDYGWDMKAWFLDKLTDDRLGEPSAAIRERVESARALQRQRFARTSLTCNAEMRAAMAQLSRSARALHRIIKFSGTIAEPEGTPDIQPQHLAEAMQSHPRRHI